jgi:hypothetical protein
MHGTWIKTLCRGKRQTWTQRLNFGNPVLAPALYVPYLPLLSPPTLAWP